MPRSIKTSRLDPSLFFAIMSAFPTGTTVVTALDSDGMPRGLTSNATCSVSADPPLLLICVDKRSNTLPAIEQSDHFVVNYLSRGSHDVAFRFASKMDAKFERVPWTAGRNGQPVLIESICGYAECVVHRRIEAGDHWVFLGEVEHGWVDPARDPLLYYRRRFLDLSAVRDVSPAPELAV